MKPKLKQRKLHPSKDPELARLAGVVGQFIEYWGFKEVQGRLWLYLFVSHDPLSSTELAQLLKISPALVTQSVKILLQYQVILTAPKGQNGVLRYREPIYKTPRELALSYFHEYFLKSGKRVPAVFQVNSVIIGNDPKIFIVPTIKNIAAIGYKSSLALCTRPLVKEFKRFSIASKSISTKF